MITPLIKKKNRSDLFEIIDPRTYLQGGVFRESEFRSALRLEDWSRFEGQRVLVKGCGKPPIPSWAYMLLLSHLGQYPRLVAYGEECAPIVVHRRREVEQTEVDELLKLAAEANS